MLDVSTMGLSVSVFFETILGLGTTEAMLTVAPGCS